MRVKSSLLSLVLASAAMAAQAADPNSTKAEAWAADFNAADVNRSGGLSQSELGATKPQQFADIKKGFAKMDANRDGQVTVVEYVAHKEKQRQTWEAAFKADYKPPFALTAKLNKLTIKVDRPKLSPEDIKKLEEAARTKKAGE